MARKNCKTVFILTLALALVVLPLQGILGEKGYLEVQAQSYPAWNENTVYTGGEIVEYNGSLYQASWWTQGDNPELSGSDANPWSYIGPAEEGGTEPTDPPVVEADYSPWSELKVYHGGDRVIYNGSVYEASWWTQGETPGAADVWKYIGPGGNGGNGGDPSPTPTGTVPAFDPYALKVSGESRILTDDQIDAYWGGIDSYYSPAMSEPRLAQYLSQADYEALFPRRCGSPGWLATNPSYIPNPLTDYYSYNNLKGAMKYLANLKYRLDWRQNARYAFRISVLNKTTKRETLISVNSDFNSDWLLNRAIENQVVDFGCFLADGTENDKKREIAAFLANIAHETGGGWPSAPDGELAWGLYFNEEVGFAGTNQIGYVDGSHKEFPPVSGESYHGRGPIQTSWNYNYGLISGILFQDISILLNNPELVAQDGELGFMTALAFWMTPQPPKASCHDVMTGRFVPTDEDRAKGITEGCFGLTINIINGGHEAGHDESDNRLRRRIGHYRDITSRNGADITGEKLDTMGMQPW